MVFLGLKGMLADRQLHRKTTEEEVVNGGGVFAVLQPLSNDMEEEKKENEFENMATEEREKEELRPYLNEDIVTKILVEIHSAESLHNNLRYVCKPWSHIISHDPDIHLNFLLPSSKATCAIIQRREKKCNPSYTTCLLSMGIREGHLKLEQQVDLTPIFKKLCIWDCCNGLVLATPNRKTLCMVNPRTNHSVVLPPRSINADFLLAAAQFTFIPSTGKYKIVTMERDGVGGVSGPYFIQILTMSSSSPSAAAGDHCSPGGGDADPSPRWRRIEAPSELSYRPITINNVYYWPESPPGGAHYITSFDVASERFYRTPHKLYSSEACYDFMDNGFMDFEGYLAFWSFRPADGAGAGAGAETDRRTFNVHVIENLHEKGGEWKKLYSGVRMDLDFIQASFVMPCMSFGNGEVMIFRNPQAGTAWAYHFKSQRWLKVGNDLKELHFLNFWGYIVRSSSTPVPFDSLLSLKQTTTTTTTTTKKWL